MPTPLYAFWSDNLLPGASTLEVQTFSLLTGFWIDALRDGDPSNGIRCNQPNGRLVYGGSSVVPKIVALFHHNCGSSKVISLKGHSANSSWGAPDVSGETFTIGATEADGYQPDLYLDRRSKMTAKAYWAVEFDSSGSALALGEWFMSATAREFVRGFRIGDEIGAGVKTIVHETYADVELATKKGFRRDVRSGQFIGTYADAVAFYNLLLAVSGRAEPLVLVPNPAKPYVMLCRLQQDDIRLRSIDGDVFTVDATFRQLSRGLTW